MSDLPDADRIADQLLPLGGPYDPDAVVEAARTVAELVRRLNHATFHTAGMRYPSHVYRVVGGLRAALHGLEQTFGQLTKRLDVFGVDPKVGHDHGRDPARECAHAADSIHNAAAALTNVTRPLDIAYGVTSHLNMNDTDVPARTHGRAFRPPTGQTSSPPASPSPPGGNSPPPCTPNHGRSR